MKVTSKTTIEVTIGDEVFQLTKEEAIALRDALNEQVGTPYQTIPFSPFDNIPAVPQPPLKWIPSNPYPPNKPEYPGWQPDVWCGDPSSICTEAKIYGGIGRSTD